MKRLNAILIFAGFCLWVSCASSFPYPDLMQKAMRCMEENVDSAQIYLSLLDSAIQYEPVETRMYYGLLTTKAQDKKYIPHSSDSLMKKVVRFYESYGDKEKLMESYYYLGSVYRDMKDAPRAIAAFQQAADVGENSQRYEVLGRIYSQMGTLLAYQSLYEDALQVYKAAYSCWLKQKDPSGLFYALRNQGRMYESLNLSDSAEYYYQAAYNKAFETEDQELIYSISIEFGNVYLDSRKLKSAKKVFSRIPGFNQNALYLQGIGHIYRLESQSDSAEFYFKEALQEGRQEQNAYLKSSINKELAKLEAQKGNYQFAFDHALKSMELEDSIKKSTRTEAIGKIQALYNYQHTEEENMQLSKESMINSILLGISLFILAVIITVSFLYIRKQKKIVKEQEMRFSDLKKEQKKNNPDRIIENKAIIADLELRLKQTGEEKEDLISQIELLEASNQKIEKIQNEKDLLIQSLKKSEVYQLFHQAKDKKDISQENWIELQEALNKTYNITKQLYGVYPKITEHELRICYLIKIQIQVKDIAIFLSHSVSAITNSRVRLYIKIHGNDEKPKKSERFDKFIADL